MEGGNWILEDFSLWYCNSLLVELKLGIRIAFLLPVINHGISDKKEISEVIYIAATQVGNFFLKHFFHQSSTWFSSDETLIAYRTSQFYFWTVLFLSKLSLPELKCASLQPPPIALSLASWSQTKAKVTFFQILKDH